MPNAALFRVLSPPQRGGMTIARHFSAGNRRAMMISPVGTAEIFGFSRPYGTHRCDMGRPGTEVPGYYHCVPPGRG